jgi:hydroxypyruvate isomerase
MPRFSANLGFLFQDRPLPDAIGAAGRAGFDAVEVHWPYDHDAAEIADCLAAAGLPLLALNTAPGDRAAGDFGLAALPGRGAEARAASATAIAYARRTGAPMVHVMAGRSGGGAAAEAALRDTLAHACDLAGPAGLTVLVEPLNHADAPGYHWQGFDHAADTIAALDRPNLALMFDAYHAGRMLGAAAVVPALRRLLPVIGHVQVASVPDRGPPGDGTLDLFAVFDALDTAGWTRAVGAEYRPPGRTEETLGWLARARRRQR